MRADFLSSWWAMGGNAPVPYQPLERRQTRPIARGDDTIFADAILHGLQVAYQHGKRDGLAEAWHQRSLQKLVAPPIALSAPRLRSASQPSLAETEAQVRATAVEVSKSTARLRDMQQEHTAATIKLRRQQAQLRRLQEQSPGQRLDFDDI